MSSYLDFTLKMGRHPQIIGYTDTEYGEYLKFHQPQPNIKTYQEHQISSKDPILEDLRKRVGNPPTKDPQTNWLVD